MKFGQKFTEIIAATHPSVSDQFLCYKTLKKCLKAIPEYKATTANGDTTVKPGEKRKLTDEQRLFLKTLNAELQKFNRFFISAEEDFVMKETKLEAAYRQVVNTDGSRAPRFTMQRCRAACRALADFHGELVLMEHWVSLNYTALVKILKKHDKRSNLSLRSPFLVSVLQQPFYSTEVLTQLITKTESRFRKLNALIASRGNEAEANGSETNGHLANGADSEDNEDVVATVSTAEVSLSLSRTKAAMECWNGLKDSDSIKRPLGDVPVLLQAKRARSS